MPTKVHLLDHQVIPLLTRMGLPRATLLEVLSKTTGERANVSSKDVASAAGYETWRWGTRYLREDSELAALGWIECNHGQVEGIRNDDLRLKLAVCSMDKNTGNPDPEKMPRNVRERGPAGRDLINGNGRQIAMEFMATDNSDPIARYDFWYFGIRICDEYVAAEISRPDSATEKGFIEHYSDRIILAKPGDLDGLRRRDPVPEDFAEVAKPALQRRK